MLGPLVIVEAALALLHGRDFAPGRFFVEVLPLTLVLAGTGLAAVARASVPVAGALAVSVLVLQGRGLAALHEAPESGLRELAGHLVRERRAGDVVAGDWSVQPVLRYYVPDPPLRPTPPFPDHPGARLLYLCRMECQPWRLHPDLATAGELVRVQEGMLPYRLLAFPPP